MTTNNVDIVDTRFLSYDSLFSIYRADAAKLGDSFQVRDHLELHVYSEGGDCRIIQMQLSETVWAMSEDGNIALNLKGWIYFPLDEQNYSCLHITNGEV